MTNEAKEKKGEKDTSSEKKLTKPEPRRESRHTIATHREGIPGFNEVRLVAKTKEGVAVGVREFEGGSILDHRRTAIEQAEENTVNEIADEEEVPVKEEMARRRLALTMEDAADIPKIELMLESMKSSMLLIDKDTVIGREGLIVPGDALQYILILQKDLEKVKPNLVDLGYSIQEINNKVGIIAEKKGHEKIVFLYAEESNADMKKQSLVE